MTRGLRRACVGEWMVLLGCSPSGASPTAPEASSTTATGGGATDTGASSEGATFTLTSFGSTRYTTVEDTAPPPVEEPPEGTPVGLAVLGMGADCLGSDVALEAEAEGGAVEAWIDVVDSSRAPGHRHEVPPLLLTGTSSPGRDSSFEVILSTSTSYVAGVSSGFSCDNGVDFTEEPRGSVLTYALRVYDANGEVDCMVVGHDYDGFVAGDYVDPAVAYRPEHLDAKHCVEGFWSP